MEKKYIFEKPELEIILFEGDLATDDVIASSGDFGNVNPGGTDTFPKGWW